MAQHLYVGCFGVVIGWGGGLGIGGRWGRGPMEDGETNDYPPSLTGQVFMLNQTINIQYLIESASPASLANLEARLPSAEILVEPAGSRFA